MLNGLDLFSGIGGITLGLSEYVTPIAYCEQDRYCQALLMSRMHRGQIPIAPIWDDVCTLRGEQLARLDIIYGGFPCQDISAAGAGVGLGGQRSGLFQHIARLVSEANPRFVFLENVPAIRTRGLNSVAQTFTELGYDCRWTVVSAAEVGAPHIRKRWFLLAHAKEVRCWSRRVESQKKQPAALRSSRWDVEPDVGRVAHGVRRRLDRLRGLGNSVVPDQAKEAFMRLMGLV